MANFPLLSRILQVALFEDWALKFICLVLAVLMWFYIDGELTDQRDLSVPLRAENIALPSGYELAPNRPMPRYTVRVRGPRRRLQMMSEGSIVFKKKIDKPQPGRNVLEITPADLEMEGFDVVAVTSNDKEPAIELVATTSRPKPVRVKPVGEPKAGYLVGKTSAVPAQVNVDGKVADLDLLEFVWAEEVDVADADQDVVRDVGIVPYLMVEGRRIDFRCDQKVRATVPIRAMEVTRRMSFDVRTMPLDGTSMAVEPKSVEVEVVAEERDLSAPDVMANVVLYVEWPKTWGRPKNATEVLGPTAVQVRVMAPPRVQVTGLNGAALPTVEVRGAAAGALGGKE